MTDIHTRPSADEMFASRFIPLDRLVSGVHGWVHDNPIPPDASYSANAKMAFVVRALNQFRAILNLLRTNHWEDALLIARSLFELALNAEELLLRQAHPESAAEKFFKFARLQQLLEWLALERYQVDTGRADENRRRELDRIESSARRVFHEFAYRDKKGKDRWRTHWANKTVADLCELSRNKARMAQYRTIYAKGSAITHSSPAGVTASMAPPFEEFGEFVAHSDLVEARGLRLVASFSVLFFLDTLIIAGDQLPAFDPKQLLEDGETPIKEFMERTPDRAG